MDSAAVLAHYGIADEFPEQWPEDKDKDSDDENDSNNAPALPTKTALPVRRSKSRYSVLERRPGARTSVPGSQKTSDGVENMVQRDEADPLGAAPSVVQVLRQRGLPVQDDTRLRNRFLLSSTTFSPSLFLSQVHNDASTEALLQGLDFLSRSIEQKSASLKLLVESNFDRFVKAKATIDNVYAEMRNQGAEPEPPPSARRPHSRHASKTHFRKSSGPFSPTFGGDKPLPSDKKKHALVKESEYGVQGIKAPLLEVAVKAEEIWGPALGGRDREENIKAVLSTVEKYRGLFEVGASIQDCVRRKDYELLVEEYRRARKYAGEAKAIADVAMQMGKALTDPEIHQIIVTARMWADVEKQMELLQRELWQRLANTHMSRQPSTEQSKGEEHMELIGILLELGVEDNPIWVWLSSRYEYLKNKVAGSSERSKIELEILRRRLGTADKPTPKALALFLKAASIQSHAMNPAMLDSPKVIEFWTHAHSSMTSLLATQGGVLGEIVEFWETAQSFIEGKAQRTLPSGPDGQSRKHLKLSEDDVQHLQNGAVELITMIRENVLSFFSDPPIEDISTLFSPIPPTPDTPRTPKSAVLSPLLDGRFKFDANNMPPPSPSRGQSWEKFAFWPPFATSLSGVHFLSKILILIGTAASEMASLSALPDGPRMRDQLKTLVGGVRERCVQAICAAWNEDAANCKVLEDWTRPSDRRYLTNMPMRFNAFENFLLTGLQRIVYLSEAANKQGSAEVVVPPSGKILQMVRSQFIQSLYKGFSGMVENVDRPTSMGSRPSEDDEEDLDAPVSKTTSGDLSAVVDVRNKNVRKVFTLSNLADLRHTTVPALVSQFESTFFMALTEESKVMRDALSQIDARLFQSYVRPIADDLRGIITAGIGSKTWVPTSSRPTDARPYIYEVLLRLVVVHGEVNTTASPLTSPILKHLLEQSSLALIDAFKARPRYSLPALMQATLDVEFLAQTLNAYTTDKASEIQSKIYVELDDRTDNDARKRLQDELQEMRGILKGLREGTRGQFACFKRVRERGRESDRQVRGSAK